MIINSQNLNHLNAAVSTMFTRGLQRTITPWDAVAMPTSSVTAETVYPFSKDLGAIREWVGERVVHNMEQGDFRIKNRKFEKTLGIGRDAIEDDTYGLLSSDFELTGQQAAEFPSEQIYGLLKTGLTETGLDGQYFFDTDHPIGETGRVQSNFSGGTGDAWYLVDASKVYKPMIWQTRVAFGAPVRKWNETDDNVFFLDQYLWGIRGRFGVAFSPFYQLAHCSRQPLDETSLTAAIESMQNMVDSSGKTLKLNPTHLVVKGTMGERARQLMTREFLAAGSSNVMKGRFNLITAPELN